MWILEKGEFLVPVSSHKAGREEWQSVINSTRWGLIKHTRQAECLFFFKTAISPLECEWGGTRLYYSWMQALSLWLIINPAPPVVCHTYLCLQLYGMTITPSTQAEAEGIKGNLEREEPRAPVIFVQSTWNRGSETQINTVRVNAGDSVWAMPFLYCQLSGHTACRSHHWLPLIITIMNVEAWIHKCYCKK